MLFKKYFMRYIPLFIVGMVALISETMLDLAQPYFLSRLIDEGIQEGSFETVQRIGLMMVGMALLELVFGFFRNYMATHVSFSFARDIRQSLYNKLLTLKMTQIESVERGSMINRLTFDVTQVQMLVNGTMRFFIRVPLFAIGGFFMVTGLGSRFVWMYLSAIPLVAILLYINLKYGFPKMRKIQKNLDHLNKKTIEYLNGIRVVKAFNRTDYENNQFDEVNRGLTKVTTDAGVFMAIFNPAIALAINLAVVVTLYLSQGWIQAGHAQVGQVVAFINYMARLIMAMSFLPRVFNLYIRGLTSVRRIEDILALSSPLVETGVSIQASHIEGGLHLNQVSYRYGQGAFALEDISFSLNYGESLGIIGNTGSGKSTLIHLLTGMIQPSSGTIHIGDQVLDYRSLDSYRSWVGYVPQDKILFSDTVANNVTFGHRDETALKEALWMASADFVGEMTEDVDTILGKGGVNISGGQKQRLSLARALYKKPKLLLLDDCTSALDAITEQKVFQGLKMNSDKLSMIVIGQKISTVRQMDRILVLHQGKIAGIGSHEDLLATCKPYQDLYRGQMGGQAS